MRSENNRNRLWRACRIGNAGRVAGMMNQDQAPPPDRRPLLPLLFGAGIVLLGLWAAWLTSSWIVLAVAVLVAVIPARTHAGDLRKWARGRARGGN